MANSVIQKRLPSDICTVVTYSYAYTIPANGNISITGANLGISTPSGYVPISVVGYNTGNTDVLVRGIYANDQNTSNNVVWLHNVSNAEKSGTFYVRIGYIRTS